VNHDRFMRAGHVVQQRVLLLGDRHTLGLLKPTDLSLYHQRAVLTARDEPSAIRTQHPPSGPDRGVEQFL
jgi:hypothetical protein